MNQQEAILQSECFKWAWNNFPETRRMFFHIPNGGNRSIKEGMKFKAMGVIPGVPDMCLLSNATAYFFEFKSMQGKLSLEQIRWHEIALKLGYKIFIIQDYEEFKGVFEKIAVWENREKLLKI